MHHELMSLKELPILPLTCCLAFSLPGYALAGSGWKANPAVIRKVSQERPDFCFEEDKVPTYTLPPLFEPGTKPSPEAWSRRRKELLELFETQVYGRFGVQPDKVYYSVAEENPAAMNGKATGQRLTIHCEKGERKFAFEVVLFLPNGTPNPVPVFLFLNNRAPSHTDPTRTVKTEFWPAELLIERGFGAAAFSVRALSPDSPERYREGVLSFLEVNPQRPDAPGSLAAWAGGAQRVMDCFQTHPRINAQQVAVVGHSRGGKAALWAGAQDERFSLVISNESGCGGAALSRRRFGETLARMNGRYPHWCCPNFHSYNDKEASLPIDQHQLLALVAPRGLYVASADEDLWSDPRGEYLALVHASPVYELLGHKGITKPEMPPLNTPVRADRLGYHIRSGSHDLVRKDWEFFIAFAEQLWRRR